MCVIIKCVGIFFLFLFFYFLGGGGGGSSVSIDLVCGNRPCDANERARAGADRQERVLQEIGSRRSQSPLPMEKHFSLFFLPDKKRYLLKHCSIKSDASGDTDSGISGASAGRNVDEEDEDVPESISSMSKPTRWMSSLHCINISFGSLGGMSAS